MDQGTYQIVSCRGDTTVRAAPPFWTASTAMIPMEISDLPSRKARDLIDNETFAAEHSLVADRGLLLNVSACTKWCK
jgi:hypothetical protein